MFKVVEEIKKIRVKVLRGDKWQVEGDLVLKKRKIYILKNEKLRIEIIQLHYDVLGEDNKVGNKKLLVAKNNKRYRKIYK